MNRRIVGLLFLLISLGFFAPNIRSQEGTAAKQPVAPVRPVTDDYYGTKIVDNYRYMEDLKDPEVQAWIKAQNDYTRAVLASIPGRAKLLERLRDFTQPVPRISRPDMFNRLGTLRLPGDHYIFLKSLPQENVSKLYVRQGLNGNDRLVVNPETVKLAAPAQGKGTNAILFMSPSQDGKYVAVGIAPGGSENDTEIHVFETTTGRETGDVIPRAVWGRGATPSWLPGKRAFVYGCESEQRAGSCLHLLGTEASKDPQVFGCGVVPTIDVDPHHWTGVVTPPDSRYALGIITGLSPNNEYYIELVADLGMKRPAWRKVAGFSDDVADVAIHGDDLYLLTYKSALRYSVIRTSARKPDLALAETVVPPGQAVVTGISAAQDALYVQLLDGGIGRVLRVPYGRNPHLQEVSLPFKCTVSVQTDPRLPGALLGMTSWTRGYRIYAYDPETKRVTDTKLQPAGPYDNPTNVESTEVKARSYDGTLVPLSIVHAKRIKLDGSNPTLLYGYGAYGLSQSPAFFLNMLAWYEQGGIYATCHVRGGGEYGEEWHLAGKGATKPNTWRDFIACAQYLISHRYTSPARLAGQGGSAGGILIGRAIESRPDLFAAAIDVVGLSDTLRFETNGVANVPEFGSVKTEEGFKALYAMSPYAHVKDHTPYPAVLLETGANDPRVAPWHSAKMTARLQAATSSGKPVLLRVEYHGGHGLGGTYEQFEQRIADEFSFLLWQLGVPGFQPPKR